MWLSGKRYIKKQSKTDLTARDGTGIRARLRTVIVWVRIPPSRLIDVVGSLMVERTVVAREGVSSSLIFPPRSVVRQVLKVTEDNKGSCIWNVSGVNTAAYL